MFYIINKDYEIIANFNNSNDLKNVISNYLLTVDGIDKVHEIDEFDHIVRSGNYYVIQKNDESEFDFTIPFKRYKLKEGYIYNAFSIKNLDYFRVYSYPKVEKDLKKIKK
jgi:hypothetical protein